MTDGNYPFSVHMKFRDGSDEHVLTQAEDPQEAIIKVLSYFREADGSRSERSWVEHVEAHWLHTEVEHD